MAVPSGRYRFTGREFESITGFQYHRARYYDPGTGRWISPDPAEADINPYRYAGNNPVNFVDRDGLVLSWASAALGAGIGAIASTAIHVSVALATGQDITVGSVVGAAVGGAVSGHCRGRGGQASSPVMFRRLPLLESE